MSSKPMPINHLQQGDTTKIESKMLLLMKAALL